VLPEAVRTLLETGPIAHVVTLDRDCDPRVSVAWVGIEGGDLVIGTLFDQPKLRNLRRDPRIALSFHSPERNEYGLNHYLVIHGRARVTDGGAPELLQRLARVYLGPDVVYPPMPNPPSGYVVRIEPERLTGVGPWRSGSDDEA
jgi:PPOX class probable F420-dependent enzyme